MPENTDAGLLDDVFGSMDESVARSTDDQGGGGVVDGIADTADTLAGSTDEALARSHDDQAGGGLVDGLAGTADHLAGSTDEAVARQTDDTAGGGAADVLAGGFWSTTTGAADWAAGSTDETVGAATDWKTVLVVAIVAYVVVSQSNIDLGSVAKSAGSAAGTAAKHAR